MSMKNTVRLAVATALAGAAASAAHATVVTTGNAGSFINVYISGSTALDNTLVNAAVQKASGQIGVCDSTQPIDIYYIGTTSSYTNRVITCTGSSASGETGNLIAIYKESTVGSGNGVQPLINVAKGGSSGVSFISLSAIAADSSCSTVGTVAATGDFAGYTNHSGCASGDVTANVVPTGGFADVEAAILQTAAGVQISASDAQAYLTAGATLDQVWGIAVTKTLYYALQAAQGLTCSSLSAPASETSGTTTITFTANDNPACAPSLSKAQVASLLTQQIGAGTVLMGSTGATFAVPSSGDSTIYLCRRDYGSGTEASFEALFVGERCSKTGLSVPGEDSATVWANGSGGGVRTCLQAFQNAGKTLTAYYSSATITPAGNQFAIGFLNTEVTASNLVGSGDAFRFVAIDGALPQIANVQNGTYPYFSYRQRLHDQVGQDWLHRFHGGRHCVQEHAAADRSSGLDT